MIKRAGICIASLLAAGVFCLPAFAGLYEKGGANGLGARAMGMAGAYTALADDETAIGWNPAGLGELSIPRFGTSLESLYGGLNRSLNLSAALPLPGGAAAGLNWTHAASVQSATIQTDALTFAGCLPLAKIRDLRLGMGLKVLFGGIPKAKASYSGVGLDLGLKYTIPLQVDQDLDLAFSIQDIDTRIAWNNGISEQIPQSIVLGSAFHFDQDTVAVMDLEMVHSGQEESKEVRILRFGLERWFRQIIGLRAGYILDSDYASTFSVGAGVKAAGWEVQYALLGQVAELGISHRLSVSYGLQPLLIAKPIATPVPIVPAVAKTPFSLELLALPEVFSPSGETLTDTVVFHANLVAGDMTQIATARLRIENAQGEVVREFAGSQYQEQYEWDGVNREGKNCTDGTYQAILTLMDTAGTVLAEAKATVMIRTELPDINLRVSPARLLLIGTIPQRPLRFRLLRVANLSGVTWSLDIRSQQGNLAKSFQGDGTVPANLTWDALLPNRKPVPPGLYTAELLITDAMGQMKTAKQVFVVSQLEPKIEMSVEPHLLKVGDKDTGKATFTIKVQPQEGIETWHLDIVNAMNKAKVRTFTGAGTPPVSLVWEAKDQEGRWVKSGEYFHAVLKLSYGARHVITGPELSLATDIGTEETGRALALHLTMVTFKSGDTTIQLDDYKRLQQAAESVKKYAKRYRLQIKGYTDNRENTGQELEISWERARKVKEYLNFSCGIPNEQMEIVGYGSRLPLAAESSPAGRAKNRRVEVVLIIQK